MPLTVGWIREARRDRQAEAERLRLERAELVRKRREQCVRLLRLARDFRVLVENTHESTGPELDANAVRVRQSAADIASQADEVEFMVPGTGTEALALAAAARELGAPIADKENRELGLLSNPPVFKEFDQCLAEFTQTSRMALGSGHHVLGLRR
ncbi:MAG: hypothetical protein J2P25_11885 [Nocardiopsaceae bacterium]|nr:hypothetical protein [Nocardiopsaceae bacterium]